MGRGGAEHNDREMAGSYWSLRPSDAPLPEESRLEMWLLKQSEHVAESDRRAAAGDFTVTAHWRLQRTREQLESDEECDRIGKLFEAQPEVLSAYTAVNEEQRELWIGALLQSPPSLISARSLSEEIGKRLRKEFAWDDGSARAAWEGGFLYMAQVHLPSPAAQDQYLAATTRSQI